MSAKNHYKPRKRPQQSRSKITNEAILEATAHILIDNGYDELTTNKIAVRAGVSIGSLYQYYPNKESIIAELVKRSNQRDQQFIESKLADLRDAPMKSIVRNLIFSIMERCNSDLTTAVTLREQIPKVKWTKKLREAASYKEKMVFELLRSRYSRLGEDQLKKISFVIVQAIDKIVNETLFVHPEWFSDKEFRNSLCKLIENYLEAELN